MFSLTVDNDAALSLFAEFIETKLSLFSDTETDTETETLTETDPLFKLSCDK